MIDAVAIMGPTGVGKSAVAVRLAGIFKGEVISVDSRQAYRLLDIGTAKPTKEQMKAVPHHMIDVLELKEKNNAEYFARMAVQKIEEVKARGKLPILAGGTGLYFRAIFEGLFSIDLRDEDREAFENRIKGIATEELRERLKVADPETYERLNPNDRYRIVRALEVYELTGVPLSEHFRRQAKSRSSKDRMTFLKIGLTMEREKLYSRINERTREMLESGWIEEVAGLIEMGVDIGWPGMKTLGYPEVIDFLSGKITRDELTERVSRLTRQYAKRQLTWFRKEKDVIWFNADDENLIDKLSDLVREHMSA